MDVTTEERNLPRLVQPRLETVRAVCFDFGDTLVSLSPTKEELFVMAARSLGLQLSLAAVKRAYQIVDFHNKYSSVQVKDRADFYRSYNEQLCEAIGISSYLEALLPVLATHFKQNKSWKLTEGAAEVLSILHERKILLALVANWDRELPELAERLGVRQFFSTIVSSQEAGVEKPDPAIFQRALADLSLSVTDETVLYVGNEYRADVLGARAAGLVPVLIDRDGLYPHADCLCYPSLRQWRESMS
jgi:HAD superfamily hydrolase (TIGR01549 family)